MSQVLAGTKGNYNSEIMMTYGFHQSSNILCATDNTVSNVVSQGVQPTNSEAVDCSLFTKVRVMLHCLVAQVKSGHFENRSVTLEWRANCQGHFSEPGLDLQCTSVY